MDSVAICMYVGSNIRIPPTVINVKLAKVRNMAKNNPIYFVIFALERTRPSKDIPMTSNMAG